MDKKVSISFTLEKDKSFVYNDETIKVKTFIDHVQKAEIIKEYIENLNEKSSIIEGYVVAENAMIAHIADICTNILVDESFKINDFVQSGLWKQVKESISNYEELRVDLEKVIDLIHKESYSLSGIDEGINEMLNEISSFSKEVRDILDLVSKKIIDVLDDVKGIDSNEIKSIVENFNENFNKLESKIPGILSSKKEDLKPTKKPGRPKKAK